MEILGGRLQMGLGDYPLVVLPNLTGQAENIRRLPQGKSPLQIQTRHEPEKQVKGLAASLRG